MKQGPPLMIGAPYLPPRPQIPKEYKPKLYDEPGPFGPPSCQHHARLPGLGWKYLEQLYKMRKENDEQVDETQRKKYKYPDKEMFFTRTNNKCYANRIKNEVGIALKAYDLDLDVKRQRLKVLLRTDEKDLSEDLSKKNYELNNPEAKKKMIEEKIAIYKTRREREEREFLTEKFSKFNNITRNDSDDGKYSSHAGNTTKRLLQQIEENKIKKQFEKEMERMWHCLSLERRKCEESEYELGILTKRNLEIARVENNKKQAANERDKRAMEKISDIEYHNRIIELQKQEEIEKLKFAKERDNSIKLDMLEHNSKMKSFKCTEYLVPEDNQKVGIIPQEDIILSHIQQAAKRTQLLEQHNFINHQKCLREHKKKYEAETDAAIAKIYKEKTKYYYDIQKCTTNIRTERKLC